MIGESFGVYVTGRMAEHLGEVDRILAFNPANEAGGHAVVDLTPFSRMAWSFQTYSPYDTTARMADASLFLESPQESGFTEQHTYGITWLAKQIEQGDKSWLLMQRTLPAPKPGWFCGIATIGAGFISKYVACRRPQLASSGIEGVQLRQLPLRGGF